MKKLLEKLGKDEKMQETVVELDHNREELEVKLIKIENIKET